MRYQSLTRRSTEGEDHNDEEEELPESQTQTCRDSTALPLQTSSRQVPSQQVRESVQNIYEYTLKSYNNEDQTRVVLGVNQTFSEQLVG